MRDWLDANYAVQFVERAGHAIDWSAPQLSAATTAIDDKLASPAMFVVWHHPLHSKAQLCQIDVWHWDGASEAYHRVGELLGHSIEIGRTQHLGMRDLWRDHVSVRWDGTHYAVQYGVVEQVTRRRGGVGDVHTAV